MWNSFNCDHCGEIMEVEGVGGSEVTCPACLHPSFAPSVNSLEGGSPGGDSEFIYTCVTCWSRFKIEEVLAIAHHEKLRGDDVLGEMSMQRFSPTQFDHLGRALDSMGSSCLDNACPHCRRKLPSGFLNQPHHIFSVVGEASSGKSYYLAVLMKTFPKTLLKFQALFTDADPIGNILLNDLKNRLFSAETPEEAVLEKTQLNSSMYELIQLKNWPEALRFPKPFVYTVAPIKKKANANGFSLVFYDNAGEHFRPNVDLVSNPGAKHVAAASGILFLFDPFHSPSFRKSMRKTNSKDPQLGRSAVDLQGVLLATMSDRIKRIRGMSIGENIRTPLAVIVGKCDAWQHLLGENPFREPVDNARLNLNAIQHNSDVLRELLLNLSAEIVINAEAISDNVRYFPVSSFGHTPVQVKNAAGQEMIMPDPLQLSPFMTEIPPLWILSQIPHTRAFVPMSVRVAVPPKEAFQTGGASQESHSPVVETAPPAARPFDFKAPCTPIVGDFNKLICAFLVAHDGKLSEAEEKWLGENIEPESLEEIVHLAQNLDYEEISRQIARMTSEELKWLRNAQSFWSQLAHCDGAGVADLEAFKWICAQIDAAIKTSA